MSRTYRRTYHIAELETMNDDLRKMLKKTVATIRKTDKAFMRMHRDIDNYEVLGDAIMDSRKVVKKAVELLKEMRDE